MVTDFNKNKHNRNNDLKLQLNYTFFFSFPNLQQRENWTIFLISKSYANREKKLDLTLTHKPTNKIVFFPVPNQRQQDKGREKLD